MGLLIALYGCQRSWCSVNVADRHCELLVFIELLLVWLNQPYHKPYHNTEPAAALRYRVLTDRSGGIGDQISIVQCPEMSDQNVILILVAHASLHGYVRHDIHGQSLVSYH